VPSVFNKAVIFSFASDTSIRNSITDHGGYSLHRPIHQARHVNILIITLMLQDTVFVHASLWKKDSPLLLVET
jgi:hypothetical protein